jgi:hypothetical protein
METKFVRIYLVQNNGELVYATDVLDIATEVAEEYANELDNGSIGSPGFYYVYFT